MNVTISKSEWEVMHVLWKSSPLSSAEVVAALKDTSWKSNTIKTLLSRLVEKGYVSFEVDKNRYLYSPTVKRGQVLKAESRSFIEKAKEGMTFPVLVNFVESTDLTKEEIKQLKNILKNKEK